MINTLWRTRDFMAIFRLPTAAGRLLRYSLAVLAVAAAIGLRLAMETRFGGGLPAFDLFYPAVMVVALVAGFRPAILTTALAGLITQCWLLPPFGHLAVAAPVDRIGLGVFLAMGLAMSLCAAFYRRHHDHVMADPREAAMRTSKVRLEILAATAFEGMVTTQAGRVLDCNEQFTRMIGYPMAELRGMDFADLLVPADIDPLTANMLLNQESLTEHALSCKDGTQILVEAHGRAACSGQDLRHTAIRDITKRRQSEAVLRDSDLRFRLALRNSPVSLACQDSHLVYEWAYNPQSLWPGFIVGKTDADLFTPDVAAAMGEVKRRVLESGTEENIQTWLTGGDRRQFLDFRFEPIRDSAGKITGIGISAVNITAQKLAEEALHESQVGLDLALVSSRMATFDFDITRNQRTWSVGVHALLGTQPETFTGTTEEHFKIIHPDDQASVRTALDQAIKSQSDCDVEYRVVWPNGRIRHVRITGKVHRDSNCQAVRITGICRDITARKLAEEALRMACKASLNIMQDAVLARQQAEQASTALSASEAEARARRAELETLMDALPIAVFIAHDAACQRITGNHAAHTLLRSRHSLNPSPHADNPDLPADPAYWSDGRRLDAHDLPMQRAIATRRAVLNTEMEIISPVGTKRQVIGSALPLFDESGTVRGSVGAFMDVTHHKLAQMELQRLNRTLRALNDSNRALRDAETETQLLADVCRIITERCGHAMVWIGYAENDPAKTIRPTAWAGAGTDYLVSLRVSWADTATGRGPSGMAIRNGQPYRCNDLRTDPRCAPWRDEALKRGYASALALPLMINRKAFGVVNIYSHQTAAFSHNEIKTLADLAGDLSVGINTLRLRQTQLQTEAALLDSEARFRSTFHNATTPMAVKHLNGQIMEINQAYCELLGYSERELLAAPPDSLILSGDRLDATSEIISQFMAKELTALRNERSYQHKDGHTVWCDTGTSLVCNPDGSAAYWIEHAHNITTRKAAEEALYLSERFSRKQWAEAEIALEAFPAHIAILDEAGVIVRVNTSWTSYAGLNGGTPDEIALGVNYLAVCDHANGASAGPARDFADGIRSVLCGQRDRFSIEYPCHSPDQQRWFSGSVTATLRDGLPRAVVAHVDITPQKRIEARIRELNQQLEMRVVERTSELLAAFTALETEIGKRQRLEREILEISEREQSRLGQDLHDGLGQELSGIAMLGDLLAKQLHVQSHPSATSAAQIADYIRSAIDSTRRLAKGHYPIALNRYGLLVALKDLAAQTSHRTGIRCEIQQSGADPQLDKTAEIHLYRIIQECIGNAIKHAKASCITIESQAGDGAHTFAVTDDGVGFDPSTEPSGMGLHLMDYRARVIGAHLTVEHPAKGGCRIACGLTV